MREKWLEETVQFFQHEFESRIHDRKFQTQRGELEKVFSIIFSE
jgi:hypothetical protein